MAFRTLVTVSLDGATFSSSSTARFYYIGLHKPSVLEAFFPEEATTLQIIFDGQTTNRAGMNGVQPCDRLLAMATVSILQGTSDQPPMCFWVDDATLVVYLTMFTDAAPGMEVAIRGNVLWPAACADLGR